MSAPAPAEPSVLVEPGETTHSFLVQLEEFSGPFDVLLSLIAKHRLDVTAMALHTVTDDFIAYIKEAGDDWSLDEATEFLVIAATLLDLKAARLLPGGEVEDEEDIAILEARDLLLARLLQYRAFKQMAIDFKQRLETAGRMHARAVSLEERFMQLMPEVQIGLDPDAFANLASRALEPKLPEVISIAHIHAARVSVREQAAIIVERLRRVGHATFRSLTLDCDTTLLVVARFLALLEIYRDGVVLFDQPVPLGDLHIRWVGEEGAAIAREIDEFDTTEVQEFRDEFADVLTVGDESSTELSASVIEAEISDDEDEEDDEFSSFDADDVWARVAAELEQEMTAESETDDVVMSNEEDQVNE